MTNRGTWTTKPVAVETPTSSHAGCASCVAPGKASPGQFLALTALITCNFLQRQLAQRSQVARLEEILERFLDLVWGVDFAFAQPLP